MTQKALKQFLSKTILSTFGAKFRRFSRSCQNLADFRRIRYLDKILREFRNLGDLRVLDMEI